MYVFTVIDLGDLAYLNQKERYACGNDPSAGSPTETLLRLHLPLNDEV